MSKNRQSNTGVVTDALEILRHRYVDAKPGRFIVLEEERANAEVARLIYDLRKDAGLTQKELAELIDTTQSVVSRLEDADYEGHSLAMLRRIAAVVDRRVVLCLVPGKDEG